MSVSCYEDLASHVGHEIECVSYGDGANVALECLSCNIVLLDFDRPGPMRRWMVEMIPASVLECIDGDRVDVMARSVDEAIEVAMRDHDGSVSCVMECDDDEEEE